MIDRDAKNFFKGLASALTISAFIWILFLWWIL